MKNFTSLAVFLLIVCTASSQKKTPDKKDDTPQVVATKPAPAKPSPTKPDTPVYKPSDAIPKPAGNEDKPRPITNVEVRDDIKPTTKPTSAGGSASDANHAISREDLESDGADSTAVEEPGGGHGTGNSDDLSPNCNTLSFQTLRCNQRWFRLWYRNTINQCAWTGDITFVNATDTTLTLYIEQHAVSDMPVVDPVYTVLLSNKQLKSYLEILPGDSLIFKMPCCAIEYEAEQKKDHRDNGRLRRSMGWVRSVSSDVRVEIKEEDLE
jgi:hypothetical protein